MLLPIVMIFGACAKAPEVAPVEVPKPAAVPVASLTPEGMAKAMDVPLYPGATAPDGMSTAKTMRDGSTHYELVLATADSPKKALEWYARKLGTEWMGNMVAGRTKGGRDVIVQAKTEAGRTIVRVKSIVYKTSVP